ncbi:hypothetical protein ACFLQR_02300, partial [Verrucomicrobiota bacterium]
MVLVRMDGKRDRNGRLSMRQSDLQRFLRTEKWLDCYYMLRAKNIAVLVDTVKPRLFSFFTFGRFGDFQQLCYNTDTLEMHRGNWGIFPYYEVEGKTHVPFRTTYAEGSTAEDFVYTPEAIDFKPENNELSIFSTPAFDQEGKQDGKMDFHLKLEQDKISLGASSPATRGKTGFTLLLYPLYDEVEIDGVTFPLCYRIHGWTQPGKSLLLKDSLCRVPDLSISTGKGSLRVKSEQDFNHGSAYRLQVESTTPGREASLILNVRENPITTWLEPIVVNTERQ